MARSKLRAKCCGWGERLMCRRWLRTCQSCALQPCLRFDAPGLSGGVEGGVVEFVLV